MTNKYEWQNIVDDWDNANDEFKQKFVDAYKEHPIWDYEKELRPGNLKLSGDVITKLDKITVYFDHPEDDGTTTPDILIIEHVPTRHIITLLEYMTEVFEIKHGVDKVLKEFVAGTTLYEKALKDVRGKLAILFKGHPIFKSQKIYPLGGGELILPMGTGRSHPTRKYNSVIRINRLGQAECIDKNGEYTVFEFESDNDVETLSWILSVVNSFYREKYEKGGV